jgi:hypothetical protein
VHRSLIPPTRLATAVFALLLLGSVPGATLAQEPTHGDTGRFITAKLGSFAVGGRVITNPGTFDPISLTPDGQTIHGDHAYVQFLIPPDARELPLVMWHGGGQFGKTYETTPDGREGFQTLFVRRGFATYVLDQPNRGRAGRSTDSITIEPVPGSGPTGEQGIFIRFRLGIWPDYFPGVQFSRDRAALVQWWRQQTPSTGPADSEVITDAVVALFDTIGPAVLITHSASGFPGWLTQIRSENVKAVVSYEPVGWVFPEGEVPPPIETTAGPITGTPIALAEFEQLTKVPIQLVYGDNIPTSSNPYPGLDIWRGRLAMAALFVDAVNRHGGDAQLLHLPDVGVFGNTHFPMSDLNNVEVANLLQHYLRTKGLDRRGTPHKGPREAPSARVVSGASR